MLSFLGKLNKKQITTGVVVVVSSLIIGIAYYKIRSRFIMNDLIDGINRKDTMGSASENILYVQPLSSSSINSLPKSYKYPSNSLRDQMVKDIYSTKGLVYDDNDKLRSIFQNFANQQEISVASSDFKKKYNQELSLFLKSFCSESELAELVDIISKKTKS